MNWCSLKVTPCSVQKLCVLVCVFVVTTTTSSSPPGQDVPSFAPLSFDCSVRRLALDFAEQAQLGPHGLDLGTVVDALKLRSLCNQTSTKRPIIASVRGAGSTSAVTMKRKESTAGSSSASSMKRKRSHREADCGEGCFVVDARDGHDLTATTSGLDRHDSRSNRTTCSCFCGACSEQQGSEWRSSSFCG